MKTEFPWIEKELSLSLNSHVRILEEFVIAGGSIHQTKLLKTTHGHFFLKHNRSTYENLFKTEMKGLLELSRCKLFKIPQPITMGTYQDTAWLLMEYLDIKPFIDSHRFAKALAALHHIEAPTYGWIVDNAIGLTPQFNQQRSNWIEFWSKNRLAPQFQWAMEDGIASKIIDKGHRLMDRLPVFFQDYSPKASLLHGDLWHGNWGSLSDITPVLFDPAIYYGDHETDLAMMLLFGTINPDFFSCYTNYYPIDPGFNTRKTLYNLYHILNHHHLFRGGYGQQAEHMIDQLLAKSNA